VLREKGPRIDIPQSVSLPDLHASNEVVFQEKPSPSRHHEWAETFHEVAFEVYKKQRSYTRWMYKIIYKTEMKFWSVLGSQGCREKKTSQLP
jgi:hypothetical protein